MSHPNRRHLMQLAATAGVLGGALAAPPSVASAATPLAPGDFDFLHGSWRVKHRKLKARLAGSNEWLTFDGTCVCQSTMAGQGNMDDNWLDDPNGAYRAMGCPVYSSAVFNFIPKTAIDFYNAHAAGDTATTDRLIREFFLPYIALRNKGHGYAVSIVKAGATLAGHTAGPVRPPLSDLKPAEVDELGALISRLGPQ